MRSKTAKVFWSIASFEAMSKLVCNFGLEFISISTKRFYGAIEATVCFGVLIVILILIRLGKVSIWR